MNTVKYQIGKNGIADNIIKDIVSHLKKQNEVKIKFLKSFLGEITRFEATDSIISNLPIKVEKKLVGNVLSILKKQKI